MTYSTFPLHFKSTIDFLSNQVALAKGLSFLDLESDTIDPAILESGSPSICWDLADMKEMPRDPLWVAIFEVGAMSVADPSQYISLDIVGAIADAFKIGTEFEVYDYSGDAVSSDPTGKATVISCGIAPRQREESTGVRFVSVVAGVVRYE